MAFATILAVVAGLTITASASFAHDVYASVLKPPGHRGRAGQGVPITAVVLGVLAIGLGILANGQNVAFLVALAFAVAASANLPTILYSLYWRRFNTRGRPVEHVWRADRLHRADRLLPAVSGTQDGHAAGVSFHWFPLFQPRHRVDPLAFILGIVGTLTSETPAIRN